MNLVRTSSRYIRTFQPRQLTSRFMNMSSTMSTAAPAVPSEPTRLTETAGSAPLPNKPSAKRPSRGEHFLGKTKKSKFREISVDPISTEGILIQDIISLLKDKDIPQESAINDMKEFHSRGRGVTHPEHQIVSVKISARSATGDGIGLRQTGSKTDVIVVPYAVIGDEVECKIYKTQKYYFESDLTSVLNPSPDRNDSLINCKYFGKCSGCQYQMLSYDKQLAIKRQVIVNAFDHYSNLAPELLPEILPTVGSPLQYNYRTKLTPHFDVPRAGLKDVPPFGFGQKGRKTVVDIEECNIGTSVLGEGLKLQRSLLQTSFSTYKRGATILLRESQSLSSSKDREKSCVTNTRQIITEYVGDYVFQFPASSFFQNNNSILDAVTSYVRENISLPSTGKAPKYLVDTYCGCGLFAITCSPAVEQVIGVEISSESVAYARKNASLNNLQNASFVIGQAEKIFDNVKADPEYTSIVIDPPRKGCDKNFLDQLLLFGPSKVVYVSCNVHSQARDIGYLLTEGKDVKYKIDSIRGFDFFPQTHHVESVAVLSKV